MTLRLQIPLQHWFFFTFREKITDTFYNPSRPCWEYIFEKDFLLDWQIKRVVWHIWYADIIDAIFVWKRTCFDSFSRIFITGFWSFRGGFWEHFSAGDISELPTMPKSRTNDNENMPFRLQFQRHELKIIIDFVNLLGRIFTISFFNRTTFSINDKKISQMKVDPPNAKNQI